MGPVYVFKCRICDKIFEVTRADLKNNDTSCIYCGAAQTRRVYTVPAVIFRGNGFYTTDYRRAKGQKEKV